MEVVFDSLIFFGRFDCLISIWGGVRAEGRTVVPAPTAVYSKRTRTVVCACWTQATACSPSGAVSYIYSFSFYDLYFQKDRTA